MQTSKKSCLVTANMTKQKTIEAVVSVTIGTLLANDLTLAKFQSD
jgi:hypothetical protein